MRSKVLLFTGEPPVSVGLHPADADATGVSPIEVLGVFREDWLEVAVKGKLVAREDRTPGTRPSSILFLFAFLRPSGKR